MGLLLRMLAGFWRIFLGAGETPHPLWAVVTCESLLHCPLLEAGLVLAGAGGCRGLWEKHGYQFPF